MGRASRGKHQRAIEEMVPGEAKLTLSGIRNLLASQELVRQEYRSIEDVLELLEWAFRLYEEGTDQNTHFDNEIAAVGLALRACQELQAAACLNAMGYHQAAMVNLRAAYECGGLSRTLAHEPELAERWLRKSEKVMDWQSRLFSKEKMLIERPENYQQAYKDLSSWAHPSARSVAPYL